MQTTDSVGVTVYFENIDETFVQNNNQYRLSSAHITIDQNGKRHITYYARKQFRTSAGMTNPQYVNGYTPTEEVMAAIDEGILKSAQRLFATVTGTFFAQEAQ